MSSSTFAQQRKKRRQSKEENIRAIHIKDVTKLTTSVKLSQDFFIVQLESGTI